jgi:hypothetical protein
MWAYCYRLCMFFQQYYIISIAITKKVVTKGISMVSQGQ